MKPREKKQRYSLMEELENNAKRTAGFVRAEARALGIHVEKKTTAEIQDDIKRHKAAESAYDITSYI